ncbi:proteasome activator subunit 4-like isoform X3 [Quercus robur]|uniref:proteasome activator subunit 4-like isoform X1 n=1 Tax=Quercus robur TaxID=38942 RepID=UPI0021613EAD|nr:proteasome activator subunit 4-like isoform X1 [Quercus robur]XP_050246120.1 proteasome activator subunit 4-like isoform X2 [Quercus robur]XP_050246121.1 proteasome activator subunit 4-like isoform X3 [Quercus robur]
MHLYNAWLPPPVAQETKREKESFSRVVCSVKNSFKPDDPDSVYSTLKWISVIDLFIKAKSDVSLEDVSTLVEIGLELFKNSQNKLYAQVRWGNILVRVLNKYRKKLSLKVQWRPLYDTLVNTHFTRDTGPEGWRLRQRHFEAITSLVRSCRRFFPPGSAFEIWSEFRSLLENPWHNSSFEGSGFVRLFLPTNLDNQDFFTNDWIKSCIDLWDSMPNCQFWNSQWAALVARVVKNCNSIEWECFLPTLFARYLNMFEVPVANGSGSYPFSVDVPRNTRFLFSNKTVTPAKAIAKAIVYLLRPGSLMQDQFEKLVNLLEQYYHPSNGGRWTYSLERFLFHLVIQFEKRLQHEQQNTENSRQPELLLGRSERTYFVNVVLKLIDRGQYSKNEHLSETVAAATSVLSYVEPSLVLPFVASRFHMALETMTATHQLKIAVMSVAFVGRSLFLTSHSTSVESVESGDEFTDLLMVSLSNVLLGMDANDPPKTLATMQLIGSIFSNLAYLDDNIDESSFLPMIRFSEWLDEFLCRLFSLLLHLEPSSVTNEGLHSSATSGTFLVEDGPYYYCMLEILLGRLSKSLYTQALKKVCKFVKTNILPGAIAEVGLLCCACVHSNPEEAVTHLIEPILSSVISSLEGVPVTGFGGRGTSKSSVSIKAKPTLSPALETSIDYQLKTLSVAISYGGPALLRYKDQFKEAIVSAFDSPSWKVSGAGDHLLRSLLGSLILYYPIDQYKCIFRHPVASELEEWISTKDYSNNELPIGPKWHIPSDEEVNFANELLDLHFKAALDDLFTMCQTKIHSDSGDEKEHLKVTLLRIDSSLQGVLSCLPDFRPSSSNAVVEDPDHTSFLIAGATGSSVGSTQLREKAAEVIHASCKYLLEEKSDDSILLILIIRIMDALANYGSLEYDEWSNHRQAWKLESAAIVEPPINFIVSSHSKGKRRPRWALIDKAYMHNTWRSSQSSYHLLRTSAKFIPSDHLNLLMDDLLNLSLHSYETVRLLAGKSLLKLIKRWPSMISKCVLSLAENLKDPNAPENVVLGSCAVLASQSVLKHLTTDPKAFSSFIIGILSSSHHESLKAQKAINELFVKYNIYFAGVSRSIFRTSNNDMDGQVFGDLVSQIVSMSFDSIGLHWRYNLMANRVLLLLAMASRNDPNVSSTILSETAGHFLKNLKSQLPQTRILAISALNTLLKESPYKLSAGKQSGSSGSSDLQESTKSSLEGVLTKIFQEEGFFYETLNSLSHVHIITDTESTSSRGHGNSSFQSFADKSITRFYFDFSASWPRTPSWISLLGSDTFYSNFARIFKRLIQECGMPVLLALRSTLEEFANAKERSKQCVAAEALAGVLHSDVDGLLGAWDSWLMAQFQNIILAQSVESIPEWAACIRYAVTGKGKYGTKVPLLRQKILDCLANPLPSTATTTIVAKRYAFLSAVLIEISPQKMPAAEIRLHNELLEELLGNMCHSSAQVREAIGVNLSVLCSNIRLYASSDHDFSHEGRNSDIDNRLKDGGWVQFLIKRASEVVINIQSSSQSDNLETPIDSKLQDVHLNGDSQDDVKWMETLFHFIISSLKSGRSSYLLDVIVGLLYPVISLQETSNKDLSTLAKAAFELLKWRIFWEPHLQEAVSVILSSANDSNWRTRSATLTYLRTFMYRHTFILSSVEKQQIWSIVEKLLIDNQVEVREHAAAVLAGLMKGGDEDLARDFRDRAYLKANNLQRKRKQRNISSGHSIASIHGAVLALTASVLSAPYDIPSWLPEHVTLLARFAGEPTPVKSTVTKAVAEFRRTHADTWNVQKNSFTEEQLEVLADTSSSSSYFA